MGAREKDVKFHKKHMKFSEFYLCFHNCCEIWHLFSRAPMRNSRIAPLSNFAAKNVKRFTLPLVPSHQKSIQRSGASPRRKLKSHSFWTVKWVARFIRANQKRSRWLPLIALDFRSEGTRRSVSLSTFLLRGLKAKRFDFLGKIANFLLPWLTPSPMLFLKLKIGRKFKEHFAFWGVANTSLLRQSFLNYGFLTTNQTFI